MTREKIKIQNALLVAKELNKILGSDFIEKFKVNSKGEIYIKTHSPQTFRSIPKKLKISKDCFDDKNGTYVIKKESLLNEMPFLRGREEGSIRPYRLSEETYSKKEKELICKKLNNIVNETQTKTFAQLQDGRIITNLSIDRKKVPEPFTLSNDKIMMAIKVEGKQECYQVALKSTLKYNPDIKKNIRNMREINKIKKMNEAKSTAFFGDWREYQRVEPRNAPSWGGYISSQSSSRGGCWKA